MKGNLVNGFFVAAMVFVNVAHADFMFHSNSNNTCDYISGHWFGTGKASNWFVGDCFYHGSGTISSLDSTGAFTAEVTADKDSGSILCPSHSTNILTGVCINGVTTILSEYGSVNGYFSQNTGSAKGTLSAGPGLKVDVDIQFERLG